MLKLYVAAREFLIRKQEGATMVEYGLMVALIAVVCIGSVKALGLSIDSLFSVVQADVKSATPSSGS